MADICLYFQAHQPHRLNRISPLEIGRGKDPFDSLLNTHILNRVSDQCYLPTNKLLLRLIRAFGGQFSLAFSLSGCLLDQLMAHRPDVILSFQRLAGSGCVEFLGETYEHSLAYLWDKDEFRAQVEEHSQLVFRLFGQRPEVFRNTELIYDDKLAKRVGEMGFKALVTEGANRILGRNSPHVLYSSASRPSLPLLLRDYPRSDDIAFRFGDEDWEHHPLEIDLFQEWIHQSPFPIRNIFMDYETFGEHKKQDSGLFYFLSHWIRKAQRRDRFLSPSQIMAHHAPKEILRVASSISWADEARDLSAWMGNDMQKDALSKAYALKNRVQEKPLKKKIWRRFLQSDHFYYMATKSGRDAEVHAYFSPYRSPHDAYLVYMKALADFEAGL